MKYFEKNRTFASFSGSCPYQCAHCYTFSGDFVNKGHNNIDEIICELKSKEFEIVYISGYKENFVNPKQGLDLLETIYNNFSCDILLTTRAVFDSLNTERLIKLNNRMSENGNTLYFCVSIPALKSYKLLEPNHLTPSPQKRIEFLKQISKMGICTILTIRPLCPESYIPISESLEIIKELKNHCQAVISSGIVVNDCIIGRLNGFPKDVEYIEGKIMNCLQNDTKVKYINVDKELYKIECFCKQCNIPFFNSSLPAINYLYNEK